jgi:hypothetical protein
MLSRCDACGGTKKVKGLGCIVKDCSRCKGVGWLDLDEKLNLDKKVAVSADKTVKKKREWVRKTTPVVVTAGALIGE